MIPWTKPEYLNLDWPKQNRLPSPNVQVRLSEALGMEYCSGWESLDGIGFDGVIVELDEDTSLYMSANYRFYHSRAYAVCTKYMSRRRAEKLVEQFGGTIMDYSVGDANNVYYVLTYRIGCTHPNMVDKRTAMHTRVQECPDCGYSAKFDTSG